MSTKDELQFLIKKGYRLIIRKNALCMERINNEYDASLVLRNPKVTWKRDIENFIHECWNLVHYNRNGCLNNLICREYDYSQHLLAFR